MLRRDRDRAAREETKIALLQQRVDQVEKKIDTGMAAAIEAALNKWELGFVARLNDGYARQMVSGVEGRIDALNREFGDFRDKWSAAVREEVRDAVRIIQTKLT